MALAADAFPAASAPSSSKSGSEATATRYTATFDDLSDLTDALALEAIGPYDGLDYEGISKICPKSRTVNQTDTTLPRSSKRWT